MGGIAVQVRALIHVHTNRQSTTRRRAGRQSPVLRHFQFGMRTLMLMWTILVVITAYVGIRIYHAKLQRRTVSVITSLGGSVTYDNGYTDSTGIVTNDHESSPIAKRPSWHIRLFGADAFG